MILQTTIPQLTRVACYIGVLS